MLKKTSMDTISRRFLLCLVVLVAWLQTSQGASPAFSATDYTTSVNENTATSTTVYTLTGTDGDGDTLSYFLDPTDTFDIHSSTGVITVVSALNYENKKIHVLIVEARDSSTTATATLTININDVNDNAPSCTRTTVFRSLDENTVSGTALYTLACTDADSSTNNNNVIGYSLTDTTYFSIGTSSGVITTSGTPLNYETTTSLTLLAVVSDKSTSGTILSSTVNIYVAVTPLNDNNPVWSSPTTSVDVNENAGVGVTLFKASATDDDQDVGGTLTYSISTVSERPSTTQVTGMFSIDANTGDVSTMVNLDRDGGVTGYSFVIEVTDGGTGSHIVSSTVTVTLHGVNDNAPVFQSAPYTTTISKTLAKAGSSVYLVSATDSDQDTTTTFTYSVLSVRPTSSVAADWEFDLTTPALLKFKKTYDLDVLGTSTYVILTIIVTDGGSPPLTGTTSVTVNISPDNEFTPTIQSQTTSPLSIPENTAVGQSIAKFTGKDNDTGAEGVLAYAFDSITSTGTAGTCLSNPFSIDSSGTISIMTELDRETCGAFTVTVVIEDSGVSPQTVTGTLTVSVTDVNDNPPKCDVLFKTVPLAETATPTTQVTTLSCNDADGDTLVYSTLTNTDTFDFTTNSMNLLKAVDYDSAVQYYDVDVRVWDGSHSQTVRVRVILDHENEHTPAFSSNPTFPIHENDMSTPTITTYVASDPDYSPDNIVAYKIQAVAPISGASQFGIDASTGEIYLKTALNYEDQRAYELRIVAEDGGGLKGTGTVTVSVLDVNDNPPTCSHYTYFKTVDENQSPVVLLNTLSCSDPDGTTLSYALTTGTAFSISGTDTIQLDANLDYETTPSYTLTVDVTDSGSPVMTSKVYIYVDVVNVNEGAPAFSPATATVALDEDVAIGTSVADAEATDPDGNDPNFGDLQYSFVSGDVNSQFYIDPSSGRVSTRKALNYENHQSYTLVIQAKEGGGTNSASMTLTVNINDLNDELPTCTIHTFSATVAETKPIGFTIYTFVCTDLDLTPALTYTITTGDTSLFEMNANTLQLKAGLNFETAQSHSIEITVSDSVISHAVIITGTVYVGSVDEGPPVFQNEPYTTSVSESISVPSNIISVTASDPDSTLDANGQVKYSFMATYSQFSIDQSTGQITVVQSLNREATSSHELIVKAADATGFDTSTVTVTVLDSNDNTPIFTQSTYSATKAEPVAASTTFVTVSATDDDAAANNYGVVTYALSGSSEFTIDPTTGAITNVNILSADTGTPSYLLYVTATDSGGLAGARTGSAVVTITITSVNSNTPVCSSPATATVNENQFAIGDIIATQSITDDDLGTDGEVTMAFETPQTKFSLTQTGKVGEVRLLQNLDFDAGDTVFNFNIKVLDKGSPAKSTTCTVTVSVNDVNDNSPLCTSIVNVQQAEGQTSIATLSCSDADSSSTLAYSIVSTTPSTISPTVTASTGVVAVGTALDYETGHSYQILVKVEDNGSPVKSTTVTVNLRITDLNENTPTLNGPNSFTVLESQVAGSTVLYTASGNSNDGPTDTLTYSLSSTTYFSISPASGEITLNTNAPDFDTVGATYNMVLYVKDSPNPSSLTATQTLTVTITDVNDNIPVFNPSAYSASVAELTAVGTTVVTVTATDSDGTPAFSTVTYNIFSGNTGGVWSIVSTTGVITTAAIPDYETATSYSLVVTASDGTNTATVTCNIQITPVNEHDPTFSPSSISLTVDEDSAFGTTLTTVVATDQDHGNDGALVYSIGAGPFMIDSNSGKIQVNGALDRETAQLYTVNVLAVDKGTTPRTGTLTLTVSIADVNDNSPLCVPSTYAASIPETATAGNIVAYLACTDADLDPNSLNNALTYAIATGDTTLFLVSSGVVKVNTGGIFDRETGSSYTLTINVVDMATSGKRTGTATVSITISDINDNAPTFTTLPSPSVPENQAVGSAIASVVATDLDSGVNKQLEYYITNGNTAGKFSMDLSAGTIFLVSSLDYETATSYSLEITVKDKGSPTQSVTGTVIVIVTDVNDKPPVCASSLYTATVAENSLGTSVVTVSCPDTETVGTVSYTISSGDANSDFSINSATGAITTSASASINYETKQSFMLEVTASDGVNSAKTYVEVTVTDVDEADPQFSPAGPYSLNVSESEAIGFTVKTVSATDADTFDTIKIYTITGGNTNSRFMMDSSSGVIKLQGLLDHETLDTYSLTLKVEDSGGKFSTTTLTVNVGDVNDNSPVCLPTSAAVSVDEGLLQTLYTPACSDLDTVATPTLKYSIASGSVAAISIDTATGALLLIGALDYETGPVHNLVIQVSDQGTPTPKTCTVNVVVNVNPVNEFSPVFTAPTYGPYSIPENTALDTSLAQVTATDDDLGLLQGTVRYYIISGDVQQQFAIDQSTGKIKVVKALDREAIPTYSLTVRAKDDDPASANEKTADAVVQIDISDVNDYTPVFNPTLYTVNVLESAVSGPAVVLKAFTVKDDDLGANAAMTIVIVSGNNEAKFSISGTDLILSAQLDYETTKSYELVLKVSDGGTPSLNSAGRVLVNVLPFNDMAPLMSAASATQTIPETTPVGTLVYDADATDTDAGADGQITYSIMSGVPNNEFVIDASTGQLFVGSLLDYDTAPNTYSVIIKATDGAGGSDAATSTTSLSIILSDDNDNYPQFTLTMFIFSISENVAVGTSVGTVVVTDKDVGLNGAVTLSKVAGSGINYFDIDATTGVVTTKASIDYEAFSVFYMTIKAQDGGTPSLTSSGLVKITIKNMNDNSPSIVPSEFAVILQEDSITGTTALTYVASDMDTGIDIFSLSTPNSFFQVNSGTGEVTTKAGLDRETTASFVLYIWVRDFGTSNDATLHTSTATLTVIVSDINDNSPIITGTYTPSVAEDSAINTLVLTIAATDADVNQNSQLVYTITAGNTGNAFKIDSTGKVQLAAALDRETTASYTLTIQVSDKGTPPLSNQVNAIVTVTDVNDNDPVFSPASYTFNVNENSNVGTAVGTVVATDKDSGANAALTYSFDSFTLGTSSHLTISGSTGAITVAVAALDREKTPTYIAMVKVTDSGSPMSRTAYAQVTVFIDDLNDNAPVFTSASYNGSVNENSATTTSVLTVVASDADKNANAAITYSINTVLLDGASANTYLKIDSSTGVISPKTAIDYETIQSFVFVVTAMDGGSPVLSGTSTVTITVVDLNDNSPVFNPTFYNAEVAYSGQCQSVITTVTATDVDTGSNGLISYSLQTAAYNYLFDMDASTGQLSISGVAETYTRYSLDIQASDAGTPIKTAATAAKVRVDTYVPNNQVVTFRLEISRTSFLSQSGTFLTNLQTVVRNKYPTALVRLWCIQEYDGVSQLPPSGRRRLLADQPVDVMYYVVKDDSSNSVSNLNTAKSFLTQDELLALVAANPQGDPGSNIKGSAWDPYRIVSVNPYYEKFQSWWDTDYGKIITALACLLGLLLVGLLIYFIVACCCGWGKKKKMTSRVTEVEPFKEPPPKKMHDYAWQPQPIIDDGGQPYRKAFPPMLITDPMTPPQSARRSIASSGINSSRGTRSFIITTNNEPSPPYTVNNRSFDGKAMDHVTGKMYEYNTKTNERRWIE